MTVQAPLHRERRCAIHARHVRDVAMAATARDVGLHVDPVMEVHEVRQRIDAAPDDRLTVQQARTDRSEELTFSPDLIVTTHARGRSGQAGTRGVFGAGVAIGTCNPVVTDMVSMIELDRLLESFRLVRAIGGSHVDHGEYRPAEGAQRDGRKHEAVGRVGPAWEELSHANANMDATHTPNVAELTIMSVTR